MTIEKLIAARERTEERIESKVNQFLLALHAAGEFAPTVTREFGGGTDYIERISLEGDNVVLTCTNAFRGDVRAYTETYPASLVNNPASVQAWVDERRKAKAEADAAVAKAAADERRASELKQLAALQAKYGNK